MPARHLPPLLARLLRLITRIENAVLIVLLAAMVLLAGGQIISRNLLNVSVVGVDQLLRLLVLWVALLGAITASRDDKHISVDLFARLLPPRAQAASHVITDLFTVVVCVLLTVFSVRFVMSEYAAGETVFGALPMWVAQLILPIAFTLITVRYLLHLVRNLRALAAPGDRA